MGASATGLDQSENSLRYARGLCKGLDAGFLRASYLDSFGTEAFDAAILISQDYGVLSPENRRTLLANTRNALRPGGLLALDAPSLASYAGRREVTEWQTSPGGFWRPNPYLLLHAVHLYPELSALCDLYAVLDGERTVYRVWQTFFSPESLTGELTEAGFAVEAVWADLCGGAPDKSTPTMGVLCRKA
jgi:SAM-dependent methyltransferase